MAGTKEYTIGRRLMVFRNVFYVIASALVFAFYFIYDYIFGQAFPAIRGLPLAAVCVLLDAIIIAVARWWCNRLVEGTGYRVTPEALEIRLGTSLEKLPWKDFERAWYGMADFAGSCPVTYQVKGKTYRPSVYLEEVWKLHQEIVEHIRPYAQIEEGLEKKISAFI